jgi:acylphosphatase
MIGTDAQLKEMIARSWQGPIRAQVQDINQENVQATLEIQDFKRVFS